MSCILGIIETNKVKA